MISSSSRTSTEWPEGHQTFSDESSVQNDSNAPSGWVWRFPSEKWHDRMVNASSHVKPTITIMVWRAIWMEGGRGCKSKLVFMERDSSSAKNRYTANSYIKALEEGLLPIYDETRKFVQDNARVHTVRKSMSWFQEHHIALWDWPPHWPDLNPIEHCWAWMKGYMRKRGPESTTLKRTRRILKNSGVG